MMEQFPIECLMLPSNSREKVVRAEVFARHTGHAHCGVRQGSIEPRKVSSVTKRVGSTMTLPASSSGCKKSEKTSSEVKSGDPGCHVNTD